MQGSCLLEQTVEINGVHYLYQTDNARGRSQSGSLVFRVGGWAREDVKGLLMLVVASSLYDLSWWGRNQHQNSQYGTNAIPKSRFLSSLAWLKNEFMGGVLKGVYAWK